jgi:hypothetical protein
VPCLESNAVPLRPRCRVVIRQRMAVDLAVTAARKLGPGHGNRSAQARLSWRIDNRDDRVATKSARFTVPDDAS